MMRAIICGGRAYSDAEKVDVELRRLGVSFVIHGGANGADRLAANWAAANLPNGLGDTLKIDAGWSQYEPSALPIRNQRMIEQGRPEAVIAFPGGRWTADMIRRAKLYGIVVFDLSGTL